MSEEVPHHGIAEGEVGRDLPEPLAPLITVEVEDVSQGSIGGVAHRPRVDVAEGNEAVGVATADLDDFLARLRLIDFGADNGQEDGALDADGLVAREKLLRGCKGLFAV